MRVLTAFETRLSGEFIRLVAERQTYAIITRTLREGSVDKPISRETFTLTIALGSAATVNPEDVADLLVDIAKYMHRNGAWYPETVRDSSGNIVGSVRVL